MNNLFAVQEAHRIVRSNTPVSQRKELSSVMENNHSKFDSGLIDVMYKQMDQFRKIDFSEISKSKGDVTKLSFFDKIEQSIFYIKKQQQSYDSQTISNNNAIYNIEAAWNNIKGRKKIFEDGFKIQKDMIMLTYNSLVMACVDGISHTITVIGSQLASTAEKFRSASVDALMKFNELCRNGKFDKAMNALYKLKEDTKVTEAFETPLVIAFSLGAVLFLVPLLRELVFYFYYLRMKVSNYLDQINKYLEINEVEIKANQEISVVKKQQIIEKQNTWRKNLLKVSDKIRVSQSLADKEAGKKMQEMNKEVNLETVKGEFDKSEEFDFA